MDTKQQGFATCAKRTLPWLIAFVLGIVAAPAQSSLIQSDYDIFVTLIGEGADDGDPLSAELGITLDSDSQTTWTLLNTTPDSSGPDDGSGTGVGEPPRIDALFFGLEGFPPLDADDLTMTVLASSDSSGWSLQDAQGSSGGAGKFELVETADNASKLGVDKRLIFTLTTTEFDWTLNTFLNAPDSQNGQSDTGFQVAASFQTVGDDGQDSGIATGRYTESPSGPPPAQVPVPAPLALIGLGLLGMGAVSRRRRAVPDRCEARAGN